jgi:hypothetical protein
MLAAERLVDYGHYLLDISDNNAIVRPSQHKPEG